MTDCCGTLKFTVYVLTQGSVLAFPRWALQWHLGLFFDMVYYVGKRSSLLYSRVVFMDNKWNISSGCDFKLSRTHCSSIFCKMKDVVVLHTYFTLLSYNFMFQNGASFACIRAPCGSDWAASISP